MASRGEDSTQYNKPNTSLPRQHKAKIIFLPDMGQKGDSTPPPQVHDKETRDHHGILLPYCSHYGKLDNEKRKNVLFPYCSHHIVNRITRNIEYYFPLAHLKA